MAFSDDVATSEGARQIAKAATPTAAGHKAADILHYQNVVIASRKWRVHSNAAQALINLGGSIPAGGPTQWDN